MSLIPHGRKIPILSKLAYWQRILSMQRSALLYWPQWDLSGRLCDEITGKTAAMELLDNGGFETAGGGGADIWAATTETVGTGAIADEGVLVHSGSHAAKLTAGATANTSIKPFSVSGTTTGIDVIPGTSCTLTFWTRGDGANAGRYSVFDNTNAAFIRATVTTGVSGTTYTQITYTFTVPAGCYNISVSLVCPTTNTGIAYFDDASLACNYPLDGVYQPAGITYGVAGIGDGKTGIQVNGTDTAVLLGNKAFGSLWNGNVGSAIAWGKVDAAGRWTDATAFRYLFHVKSRLDATVYIAIGKTTTNHQLVWRRRVAGANYDKTYTFNPTGTLDWFCMGMTWDVVSNPKRIATYLYTKADGVWQKVTDEAPATGNESWVNATYPADDINVVNMAGSLTAQEWIGSGAHIALWNGVALSDGEMKKVMVP